MKRPANPALAVSRLVRRRRRPTDVMNLGAPPGTVRLLEGSAPPVIDVIAYGPEAVEERRVGSPAEARALVGTHPVVWINVNGLGDPAVIEAFGREFSIHRLTLEDITTLHQRAKVDPYESGLYIVARMTYRDPELESEQLSLFLDDGLLITFQEREGDCLDPVRRRIRDGGGQVRTAPADYLAYCVLDAVVDAYYPLLEAVGDTVEELERSIVERPGPESVVAVRELKKDLLIARKAVWPLREALHTLIRDPLPRISDETRVYLRDCLDHCAQIIDMIETDRELVTGLMDIYMSSVSNRMNEIMKVLTIFAAIFIPLTFIAGIYGMNFNPDASPWNMPELKARYGYPLALGIMASTALIMLLYFRRKKWIGR